MCRLGIVVVIPRRGMMYGRNIGERAEGQAEREVGRQKSRVQLLQGTPNQDYALRGRGPPDKR